MKRMLSMLLILSMLLSLLSGCGGEAKNTEQTIVATEGVAETAVPEVTEIPTTAPALSPEEVLYNSLSDRMKQAVKLGIVELEQLKDLNRVVTIGEAAAMLQAAYVSRTLKESKTLSEWIAREEFASRNATRGWLAIVPGMTDLELVYGDQYETYEQWQTYVSTGFDKTEALWWTFPNRLGTASADYMHKLDMPDEPQVVELLQEDPLFSGLMSNLPRYGALADIYPYAFSVFDATNGKKFIAPKADGTFHALGEVTVAEIVESALCFYNYPNPAAIPEFVAPEEMGSYNPAIITDDLRIKETDLPDASSQKLPAQWRGIVMDDMDWLGAYPHLDCNVYEYEIKAVKDAGFNFIGFNLDFNWLQDYWLYSDEEPYKSLVDQADKGKLSSERLQQLDQVLAWCMKYDIHLNLRCSGMGNYYNSHQQNMAMLNGVNVAKKTAVLWQAIARRYADIPNKYLSFTVLSNPVFHVQNNVLTPMIEAIQAETPERCLMVEIYGNAARAQKLAEMGVALSYRIGEPYQVLEHKEYYKWNHKLMQNDFVGQTSVDGFTWPYGDMDGEKTLATGLWGGMSCLDVMHVAEENGVGFMVSDFGVNLENSSAMTWPAERYADEPYRAMITDVLSAIESHGYGWCFAHWYGYFGIASGYPAFENVTYAQLEDYPYYIDTAMQGWFKEINGVA